MKHLPTLSILLLLVGVVGFTNADYQPNLSHAISGWLQFTVTPPSPILAQGTLQTNRANLPVATVTSFIPLASSTDSDSNLATRVNPEQDMSETPTSTPTESLNFYQTERINPVNAFILILTDAELGLIQNDQLQSAFAQFDQQQLITIVNALDGFAIPTPQSSDTTDSLTVIPQNDEINRTAEATATPPFSDESSLVEEGRSTDEPVGDMGDSVFAIDKLTGDELSRLEPITLARILRSRPIEEVVLIISDVPYDLQLELLQQINADFVLELPTPTREATPTSAPSDTPAPTPIPLPTVTFTPTEIILPSATFTVTDRPLPTNTSIPTEFVPTMTYTVTERPLPTDTPQPTQVVLSPTHTSSPAYQASPTFTPSPIPPPTATRAPTLIPTPSPTKNF